MEDELLNYATLDRNTFKLYKEFVTEFVEICVNVFHMVIWFLWTFQSHCNLNMEFVMEFYINLYMKDRVEKKNIHDCKEHRLFPSFLCASIIITVIMLSTEHALPGNIHRTVSYLRNMHCREIFLELWAVYMLSVLGYCQQGLWTTINW